MQNKDATNATEWALLVEAVASARVEAHRLRQLMHRALYLIDSSEKREHFYQIAGDVILSSPDRMTHLERHLNRASYALAEIGTDVLKDSLPLSDRNVVEDGLETANIVKKPSVERVANKYLESK